MANAKTEQHPWNKQRSIFLPLINSVTIDVSFENIRLNVSNTFGKSKKKEVLKGLNGVFKSGDLTAIMGPSGAGKSSLLNVLTGFQTDGMTGKVFTNGQPVTKGQNRARKLSAYITQDDALCPLFTVDEVMYFAATLKIGTSLISKARRILIDDILDSLYMSECRNTRCGALSGGQKKRLSIALELIDNPSVIYLDEPTTGLDSSSCLQLVKLLSQMARRGKTVICTIHQPSATMFEMMDHIYVISEGLCVYQGSSHNVIPFLKSVNLSCPQYHNPADFILEVASGEYGCYNEELIMACKTNSWREPSAKDIPCKEINEKQESKMSVLISPPSEFYRTFILMKHIILQSHRDWGVIYLKLVAHIVLGSVIGFFYHKSGQFGDRAIKNVGYLMAIIVYASFVSLVPAILKFPKQMQIIKKERFNNWYTFRSYFIAFFLINTPLQVALMSIFAIITYTLSSQLLELFRISVTIIVIGLITIISEYTGIALGTASNPANSIFVGSVMLAVMLLFAGFGIFLPHMPIVFYYCSYISFMRFSLESLVVGIYGFGRGLLECPREAFYCHIRFPSTVLKELGMFETNLLCDLIVLVLYALGAILLAYIWIGKSLKK